MLQLNLFGGFSLSGADGAEISLRSQKAKALLAYLAMSPNKKRSRQEIMALLWSDRGEAQARASLRQVLSGLRKEPNGELLAGLEITDEAVSLRPELIKIEGDSTSGELLAGFHLRDASFEEWLRDERMRLDETTMPEGDSRLTAAEDKPSIVILPFVNISGDAEQEYFADGITEDIITALSRFDQLLVIARSSSFHFKGQSPNVQELGSDLGVQYVVEGSVRKSQNRVRISVQLAEVETGKQIWAERYDRELEDIFSVQDEVVSSIAMMVPGRVEVANTLKIENRPTKDIRAYDLFLRANQIRYKEFGAPEIARLLERVLEIDPNYAEAHAHLASSHAYSMFLRSVAYEEAEANARKHAAAAAKAAPDNALVHANLSNAYAMIGDHGLVAHHLKKALVLNPNNFAVLGYAAISTASLGNHQQAIELIEKALQNDPYSAESYRELKAEIYYVAGQYQDALDQFTGWLDPPLHLSMLKAAIFAQLGLLENARMESEAFESKRPTDFDTGRVVQAYCRTYARKEDKVRFQDGFYKAGLVTRVPLENVMV